MCRVDPLSAQGTKSRPRVLHFLLCLVSTSISLSNANLCHCRLCAKISIIVISENSKVNTQRDPGTSMSFWKLERVFIKLSTFILFFEQVVFSLCFSSFFPFFVQVVFLFVFPLLSFFPFLRKLCFSSEEKIRTTFCADSLTKMWHLRQWTINISRQVGWHCDFYLEICSTHSFLSSSVRMRAFLRAPSYIGSGNSVRTTVYTNTSRLK